MDQNNDKELVEIIEKFQDQNNKKYDQVIYAFTLHPLNGRLKIDRFLPNDAIKNLLGAFQANFQDRQRSAIIQMRLDLTVSQEGKFEFSLSLKNGDQVFESLKQEARLAMSSESSFWIKSSDGDVLLEFFYHKPTHQLFAHLYQKDFLTEEKELRFVDQQICQRLVKFKINGNG